MKVIDFHPDDLLDRELTGSLSAPEQRRLLEHLERCHTCRLERQLRADFRAELARPALEQALHSSVSGALRAALPESSAGARELQHAPGARRRRALPALAAVAIVVASGVAAAQSGWGERVWELARTQAGDAFRGPVLGGASAPQAQAPDRGSSVTGHGNEADLSARVGERSGPAAAKAAVAPGVESARESAQGAAAPSAEAAAPGTGAIAPSAGGAAAPKVGAPSVKRARARARKVAAAEAIASARGRTTKAGAASTVAASTVAASTVDSAPLAAGSVRADSTNPRVVSSVASSPAEAVLVSNQAAAAAPEPALEGEPRTAPEAPQAPVVSAAVLFDQASSARRQGRIAEALRLYAALRERFITSPEARLSLALVARMRLDQGEPEAAIAGFEAYLATFDGALREQAMAGRALALGRLGLTSQEKAGWRDLLRAYPNSSYAELAERRLGDAIR